MFALDPDRKTTVRLDRSRFMAWHDDLQCYDPANSRLWQTLHRLPPGGPNAGEEGRVTARKDARPDLLSYDAYGDTQYWWVILVYNDLTSFSDVKAGESYRYPRLTALDGRLQTLNASEDLFL